MLGIFSHEELSMRFNTSLTRYVGILRVHDLNIPEEALAILLVKRVDSAPETLQDSNK